MNAVFDWCVSFLVWLANLIGLTYVQVNVAIFCIIWPALTLGLIYLVWVQKRHIKYLEAVAKHHALDAEVERAIAAMPPGSRLGSMKGNPTVLVTYIERGGRSAQLGSNGYILADDKRWIECLTCHMRSFNTKDVENLYCAKCEVFHVPNPEPQPVHEEPCSK